MKKLKNETNSSVYRKLYKKVYANCPHCGWNRGENQKGNVYRTKTWKDYRQSQYRTDESY